MSGMVCGGTKPPEDATEDIQDICNQVKATLEQKMGKTINELTALRYTSQVVAGTNYFVKAQVDGKDHVHLRIFKALACNGGNVELHGHKKSSSEIKYFDRPDKY